MLALAAVAALVLAGCHGHSVVRHRGYWDGPPSYHHGPGHYHGPRGHAPHGRSGPPRY
ncbi:MAG: hypothetical protein R3B49_08595 [Phycisphaerales bacterium]